MFGKLTNDWMDTDKIIIYGFGNMAQLYLPNLLKHMKIRFIIDNNKNIEGKSYEGIPIYSYQEAKKMLPYQKIVIAAETLAYNSIKNTLEKDGFIENKDFTGLERFICEWFYKRFKKVHLLEIHTAVNTKCTFRCEKCNMFIPYYKTGINYSREELTVNLEQLFRYVDYIYKYQLVGGEPFLNPDLPDFLRYLGDTCQNKIGRLRIITNGSVIPSDELCAACQHSNVEIHISDYTHEIPYIERLEKTITKLKAYGINYKVNSSLKWRDFGFPETRTLRTPDETLRHMYNCGTAWHGLQDKRLQYCNSAWSASKAGLFDNSENDYVELSGERDIMETKIKILKLCLGELDLGYSLFCQLCGGCGDDNNQFVTSGVQMENPV